MYVSQHIQFSNVEALACAKCQKILHAKCHGLSPFLVASKGVNPSKTLLKASPSVHFFFQIDVRPIDINLVSTQQSEKITFLTQTQEGQDSNGHMRRGSEKPSFVTCIGRNAPVTRAKRAEFCSPSWGMNTSCPCMDCWSKTEERSSCFGASSAFNVQNLGCMPSKQ